VCTISHGTHLTNRNMAGQGFVAVSVTVLAVYRART
jgi:hypothetical protein